MRKYNLIIGKKSIIGNQIFSKNKHTIFLSHSEQKKINYYKNKAKFVFFFIGNRSNSKMKNNKINFLYPKKIIENLKDESCKLFFFGSQNEYIKFKNIKENYYGDSKKKLKSFLKLNHKNYIWIILPSLYSKKSKKGFLFYLKNSIKNKTKIMIKNPDNKLRLGHVYDTKSLLKFLMLNFNKYRSQEIIAPSTKFLSVRYIVNKIQKKYNYTNITYLNKKTSNQKIFFPKFKFIIKPKNLSEYI